MFSYFIFLVPMILYQAYEIVLINTVNGKADVFDVAFTRPNLGVTAVHAAIHLGYAGIVVLVGCCYYRLRQKREEFVNLTNLVIENGLKLNGKFP